MKKSTRGSRENRMLDLPNAAEMESLTPEEKLEVLKKQEKLKNIADEDLRSYQKNKKREYSEALHKGRLSDEIDDIATMGSDSHIIYKPNSNYDVNAAQELARPHTLERLAAESELGERGYKTLRGLKNKMTGTSNPSKLYNPISGKILKSLGALAPMLKTAGKIAPLVGAYSSFSEAKEAGMSNPQALAYTAAEEANPLPISGIDYYKGMEDAAEGRRKNQEESFKKIRDLLKK